MDRTAIRTAARELLNEATASFWSNTELDRWLNFGIQDINAVIRVESNTTTTGNTVADTATISLAAGVIRIFAARLNTDPLKRTTIQELVALDADLAATGTPTHYYQTRDATTGVIVVNLWPIPDKAYAYTIWTLNELAELTADGQSPALPVRHHHRFVNKILSMAYSKGGRDPGAASGYSREWIQDLRAIVADLMNNQEEGYTVRYVDLENPRPSSTWNPLEWP